MITTLLFDIGGTIHTCQNSPERRTAFAGRLIRRLAQYGINIDMPYEDFGNLLHENSEEYKHMTEEKLIELPTQVIWNDYYLKQFNIGRDVLAPISEELSFIYDYERVDNLRRPKLKETMQELHDMGIRLGIISNIISTSFVPHILKEYGIEDLMECVVMSSVTGTRKPGAEIFRVAMDQLGVTPEETGYVGDTISRDVRGSRNAGLGLCIRIEHASTAHRDKAFVNDPNAPKPDFFVKELYEIPPIIKKLNLVTKEEIK